MIGLLLGLLGFGKSILLFFQHGQDVRAQQMSDYWRYQLAFIQATAGMETQIVRQLIVATFATPMVASIFNPTWAAIVADQMTAIMHQIPPFGWLIIVWEFFGAAALSIVPGYQGNGKGIPNPPQLSNGSSVPEPVPAGGQDKHSGS